MTYTGYEGPDPIGAQLLDKLNGTVLEYTALNAQLSAADGDRAASVESYMETADDAQAVKLRTTIENATAKLRELAEKNVVDVSWSDEDKEKVKTQLNSLKDSIRSGHAAIIGVVDTLGTDPEGVKAALASIGDPTRSGRGRKPGQAGSSLPRASVIVTVNGGNLENAVYDSFSKVATVFNCEVKDVQAAFAAAAGVDPMNIKTVNEPVEFTFQPNENGSVYLLNTTPKERKKPGPRGKTEQETTTEAA